MPADHAALMAALATVVEEPASQVFVMLYDMSAIDEQRLDRWEGSDLGLYVKVRVRVATLEGEQLAWLYVLDDYEGGLPSAHYLGVIADAAEAGGAPRDYVERLRTHPCRGIGDEPVSADLHLALGFHDHPADLVAEAGHHARRDDQQRDTEGDT